MSTAESTRLLTAEEFYDFCHLPENRDRHFELERGEVVEMSRPGETHCYVCANVTRILGDYAFNATRGMCAATIWASFGNAGPTQSKARISCTTTKAVGMHQMEAKYPQPASPRRHRSPLAERPVDKILRRTVAIFRCGTPLVWVVDPEDRTVSVFRPNQIQQVFDEGEELTGGDELPDFRCRVAEFFAMPGE